jgi:class 3 adenylate cyclase
VEQIADWLEKLGLGQYAKLFADNDIDVSVLPHITDQDLKDLGVSLGHRRKIFAAVNKGLASVEPLAEAERAEEPLVQDGPERRYVTVLFSDLVGSTALSTRLDPEDLRDVIAVYQRCVEETVRRFDGFIAKFLGDGVLVYFGYPEAHENDPEQAVRAGLELVAAVRGLQTPEPLEARVGIATGLVVVGDMIGSGASQEQSILGKTPNLAARLQGIAEPSMVVIADSTRKLLGNLFELEDLGGKDLKGIEGPERAWAVFRANPVDSRFDAFHAMGVTELVGRQEELDLLLRRWSKAASGEGQVVLLSGEPGIGKSRPPCWNASPLSRTRAYGTSVRRSTLTAPCIRSSIRWSVPADLRTMIRLKQNSTSWIRCSLQALRRLKIGRFLLTYYRYRTMIVIPNLN